MSPKPALPGFAVVTGAASGMGQATAQALVAAGVSGIALIDVNTEGLESTRSAISTAVLNNSTPPAVRLFTCDVSKAEAVEETWATIHKEFGRIDYSVHCAGVLRFCRSLDMSLADFDLLNSVNYRGLWLCQRAALTVMRTQSLNSEAYPDSNIPSYRAQRGAIVNISSCVSARSMHNVPIYSATKSAVLSLTKSDAIDYADDRIRINAVMPGAIDTPMVPSLEVKMAYEESVVKFTPAKRWGTPDEVADVIVFLCGTGASFVTGSGWSVDGGLLAG